MLLFMLWMWFFKSYEAPKLDFHLVYHNSMFRGIGCKALIATWWIFLIFMINCYVANLAASTTVSQINDNSSKLSIGLLNVQSNISRLQNRFP